MSASFGVELLKLRKRPATWVLGIVLTVVVIFFGYFVSYLLGAGAEGAPPEAEQFLETTYPENVLSNVLLQLTGGIGGAVALILGALAVGSEYGWETLKLALTQRLGKLHFLAGKLLAVGVALALFVAVLFAAGAVSSYVVAGLRDVPVDWPPVLDVTKALGAGWLILAVFAAMGAFLAVLFRGSALAIGLGLVYLLVLEGLVLNLPTRNETLLNIREVFPGKNAFDLTQAFGEVPVAYSPPGAEAVEPTQAVLVLGAYLAGFLVFSVLIFRQREVK